MRPENVPDILIHLDDLYRFAFVMLGRSACAEDAVRSVYRKVRDVPRVPSRFSEPASWYFSILVKETRLRRKLAWKLVEDLRRRLPHVDAYQRSPDTPDDGSECRYIIEQLQPLTADEAAAILLHDVFDLVPASCCEIIGVSQASFRQLLFDARAGLMRGASPSRLSEPNERPCQDTARAKAETA